MPSKAELGFIGHREEENPKHVIWEDFPKLKINWDQREMGKASGQY